MSQVNRLKDKKGKWIAAAIPTNRPTINTGPGKTKQEFKDECDVAKKLERAQRAGLLDDLLTPKNPLVYADVSNIGSFQEMAQMVRDANAAFESLPAKVREYFDNDPEKLIEFVADKENLEEAKKLGLVRS